MTTGHPTPSLADQFCADHPGVRPAGVGVILDGSVCSAVVRVGERDQAAVDAYLAGQCHALALALHERTGWPLFSVGPSTCYCEAHDDDSDGVCSCQVEHLAVRSPDGLLVDIYGPICEEDFLQERHPETDVLRPLTDDRLAAILYSDAPWRPPDMATARGFVDVALKPLPDDWYER